MSFTICFCFGFLYNIVINKWFTNEKNKSQAGNFPRLRINVAEILLNCNEILLTGQLNQNEEQIEQFFSMHSWFNFRFYLKCYCEE